MGRIETDEINDIDVIDFMEDKKLVTTGCATCMRTYGACAKAISVCKETKKFVTCSPFDNLDEKSYPAICLEDWGYFDVDVEEELEA